MKQKAICILNPFISSKYLTTTFRENGIETISLLTDIENAKLPRYDKTDFIEEVILSGEIEQDAKLLKEDILQKYEILSLINGIEGTLAYGDLLAHNLSLLGNSIETSDLRFDKNSQIEALHRNNIPAPKNIKVSHSIKQITGDITKNISYPVIIKPSANSSGSKNIEICSNHDEVLNYFISTKETGSFQKCFSDFCIQELMFGDEIVVDTVSHNEKHYLTSCWLYTKEIINNTPVYRTAKCLQAMNEVTFSCFNYTKQVLGAIDLKEGFAHTELILTPEPKLIEVNARTSGAYGAFNSNLRSLGYINQASKYSNLLLGLNKKLSSYSSNSHLEIYFFYNFNNYSKNDFMNFILSISNTKLLMINPCAIVADKITLGDCYAIISITANSKQLIDEIISKISRFEKGTYA